MNKLPMRRPVKRRGSVMIELIVVAFLIGVTGIALYLSLLYGGIIGNRSHHLSRASQIAAQEVEIIRSMPYASLTVPYDGSFLGTTDDPAEELTDGAGNLTTSYYNSPTNTIKQAVVTVSWTERGEAKSIQYTTLVADEGINQ